MLNRICYLFGIPLVWFLVVITLPPYVDKVYVFAVAPAVWMLIFVEGYEMTAQHFLFGGLVGISLVGPVLLAFKIKLRTAITTWLITTFVLWMLFSCVFSNAANNIAREHTVSGMCNNLTSGKVVFSWLLCSFNFSLCLVPIFTIPAKLLVLLTNKKPALPVN